MVEMQEKENIINQVNDLNEKYDKLLKKNKKRNILIIILGIIIILLIVLLVYKLGRIGFDISVSADQATDDDAYVFEITDDLLNNSENTENKLDIFKNKQFGSRKIIAPRSKGNFKFYVKNDTSSNISYDISVIDEMSNFVNMKYKLKLDGEYIKGNTKEYVEVNKLNMNSIALANNSYNLFELEWYWEDDDKNDTYIGNLIDSQYYTLQIKIIGKKLHNQ